MANALQLIGGSVPKGLENHTKERKVIRIIDTARKDNSMTDKKKLHRVLSSLWKNDESVGKTYYNQALQDVQTAIDLQEEPVSEDLEKAAKEHSFMDGSEDVDEYARYNLEKYESFKTGAKWQEKKDQSTIELAEDHAMLAGMEKMKEEMMAIGVDGVVHHLEKCKVASVHYNDPNGVPMAYFIPSEGLSAGDKVKIITIKKD